MSNNNDSGIAGGPSPSTPKQDEEATNDSKQPEKDTAENSNSPVSSTATVHPTTPTEDTTTQSKSIDVDTSTKKKRRPDKQISKEECENEDDDEDGEGSLETGTFSRASSDVIKKRRIVKAARRSVGRQGESEVNGASGEKDTNGKDRDEKAANEQESKDEIEKPSDLKDRFEKSSDSIPQKQPNEKETSQKENPFAAIALSAAKTTPNDDQAKDKGGIFSNSNTFALSKPQPSTSTSKTQSSSVFGSGTSSGFGSVTANGATKSSLGFGSVSSSGTNGTTSTTSGFGSFGGGFASTSSKSTPTFSFGTTTTGKSAFGTSNGSSKDSTSTKDSHGNSSSTAAFPKSTQKVSNGEEGEQCIFEIRAKLYKLVSKKSAKANSVKSTEKTGIPHSSELKASVDDDKNGNGNITSSNKNDEDWQEVGIGPLRILQKSEKDNATRLRLVQRRESSQVLILNARLRPELQVLRKGEKYVALNVFEKSSDDDDDEPSKETKEEESSSKADKTAILRIVKYLFKVKTVAEADSLEKALIKHKKCD